MQATRVKRMALVATFAGMALGLVGGAAKASLTSDCNPSGRAICIEITDHDEISHSSGTVNRYTMYTIVVSNGGGSRLTNGTVTVSLKDVVNAVESTPTGAFVAAPSGCTSASSTAFSCELPNLAAGAPAPALQAFAKTSTNTAAEAMRILVTATFKERGSDSEGPASQSDTFTLAETTSLEPRPDFGQSIVFRSGSTVLETFAGHNGQSSRFRVPVGPGFTGFTLATLEEFSSGESGYFCPSGFTCFGQSVSTAAAGVFSAANLANLVSTVDLDLLPSGVTERSLRVHHDGQSFTTKCSGDLFTPPSAAQVPCRRVDIDRRAGIVTIDVWDNHQGDWGFS